MVKASCCNKDWHRKGKENMTDTGWPTGTWHLLNGQYSVGGSMGGTRWLAFFSSGLATFNKIVPQRTLQTSQWPLFKTCFPGTSFPVSEKCRGPPRSPVLSKCDFFLWGYFKSRVYIHKPRTLNDLKAAIRQEIRPINLQLLTHVMDDFKKRLENCIQEDGRHLTNIIFKT